MADDGTDTTARRAPTRMPRWVKVFVIIGVAGALLLIALLLTQGGHGPGQHSPAGDTAPSDATRDGGHTPPAGGHG